jgi:hypothetical protein
MGKLRATWMVPMLASLAFGNDAVVAKALEKSAAAKSCRMAITDGQDPDALISGTVVEREVWGPPNFGERPKTDSRYRVWIISLDDPIQVTVANRAGGKP